MTHVLQPIKTKQKNCLGVLAITDLDLFTGNMNFVFGAAYLQSMVGVQSVRRYMPDFTYDEYANAQEAEDALLKRCVKTTTHEIGHMFGLKHCIYYECLMMGSNHAADGAKRPAYFCPVCYHKLHKCLNFEHVSKAKAMMDVCNELYGAFVEPKIY